jgi:hypothetical protein
MRHEDEALMRVKAAALIDKIQNLEDLAHRSGMVRAAQALNKAKNETGWELAEKLGTPADPPEGGGCDA